MPRRLHVEHGFTIVEALVAVAIAAIALTSVAQLFVVAARSNDAARRVTRASWLAAAKMQELRSFTFEYGAAGAVLDDPRLAPSPSDALSRNVAGYSDFLNANGMIVDDATVAAFVRRWTIEPQSGDAIVIAVAVYAAAARTPDAQLMAIRRRTAPSWRAGS